GRHRSQGSAGGRRRGDSDRRCAQCAPASLDLCLNHRRDRADPQRHYRRLRRQGVRCADRHRSARALALLHEWGKKTGAEMNEARPPLRRTPQGQDLILNKVSGAPRFWIGNVIVMAGVPSIMQAMLDKVVPKLKIGVRMLSETVRADAREGDIGMQLGEIAKAHPAVAIGSYPFFDPQHGPNTNVVLRARNPQKLAFAKRAVEVMLERVRRAESSS